MKFCIFRQPTNKPGVFHKEAGHKPVGQTSTSLAQSCHHVLEKAGTFHCFLFHRNYKQFHL